MPPPSVPRRSPARDPILPEFDPLPPLLEVRAWNLTSVLDFYVRHEELKSDLARKTRCGVDSTRFRTHCALIPEDVRALYGITPPEESEDGSTRHAANGRRQARICVRIDEALAAAMACREPRPHT